MKYKEVVKKTMEFGLPTLTDSEREYLSAVIKPFRDEIKYITKHKKILDEEEWICISTNKNIMNLFAFEKSKYYQGMETDKEYTLEELGL